MTKGWTTQGGGFIRCVEGALKDLPLPHDAEMWEWRHPVENFFCQIKILHSIATRYDKTDTDFAAVIDLVATVLATGGMSTGPETRVAFQEIMRHLTARKICENYNCRIVFKFQ